MKNMENLEWVKTEWNGNGAEFVLAPAGSVTVPRYVSLSGLTGESRVIAPAWTSTGEYRQIWRYFKDAAHAAWRDGAAWYAAPVAKSKHPSEWGGDVVAYAREVTRQDLEEVLHFSEPLAGSKTLENWKMFWAWTTRPSTHPQAWPLSPVASEFAGRLLASQSVGHFYNLPEHWGKVFPLTTGSSLYWDDDNYFVIISKNCPDDILGSLLSPEIAAKRQRWEL